MHIFFISTVPNRLGTSQFSRHVVNTSEPERRVSKNTLRMTQVVKSSTIRSSLIGARKPTANPNLTAEGDSLESAPYQKALLALFIGSASTLTVKIAALVDTPEQALANIGAVVTSYFFTDFAIGVYHHAVDNYGSAKIPIFGYQISAFQGHHFFPWTITSRDVVNNLYRLTYPTLPQLFLLMILHLPSIAMSFYGSFLCFIVLSQETHRQAHMVCTAPWVNFLQDTGLIISRKAHAAHHRAPPKGSFEGNYCILSGVWNPILDHTRFFRLFEALIFRVTGIEPICWSLDHRLKEEAIGMLPSWLKQQTGD